MNRVAEYIDMPAIAPVRRPAAPDEPATLVDVFNRIPVEHKRPDTLNYKSGDRWIAISAEEMLARAK